MKYKSLKIVFTFALLHSHLQGRTTQKVYEEDIAETFKIGIRYSKALVTDAQEVFGNLGSVCARYHYGDAGEYYFFADKTLPVNLVMTIPQEKPEDITVSFKPAFIRLILDPVPFLLRPIFETAIFDELKPLVSGSVAKQPVGNELQYVLQMSAQTTFACKIISLMCDLGKGLFTVDQALVNCIGLVVRLSCDEQLVNLGSPWQGVADKIERSLDSVVLGTTEASTVVTECWQAVQRAKLYSLSTANQDRIEPTSLQGFFDGVFAILCAGLKEYAELGNNVTDAQRTIVTNTMINYFDLLIKRCPWFSANQDVVIEGLTPFCRPLTRALGIPLRDCIPAQKEPPIDGVSLFSIASFLQQFDTYLGLAREKDAADKVADVLQNVDAIDSMNRLMDIFRYLEARSILESDQQEVLKQRLAVLVNQVIKDSVDYKVELLTDVAYACANVVTYFEKDSEQRRTIEKFQETLGDQLKKQGIIIEPLAI